MYPHCARHTERITRDTTSPTLTCTVTRAGTRGWIAQLRRCRAITRDCGTKLACAQSQSILLETSACVGSCPRWTLPVLAMSLILFIYYKISLVQSVRSEFEKTFACIYIRYTVLHGTILVHLCNSLVAPVVTPYSSKQLCNHVCYFALGFLFLHFCGCREVTLTPVRNQHWDQYRCQNVRFRCVVHNEMQHGNAKEPGLQNKIPKSE